MKVTGPGSGAPPEASSEAQDSGTPGTEKAGAAFSEKLASGVTGAVAAPASTPGISEIAAGLESGQLTSAQAVDQVVERIVTRQLGVDPPAAVRKQLETALRQALEDDPVLVQQVRQLG
jgi:hypothetical protein